MNADESLDRYGLRPAPGELGEIRALLADQAGLDQDDQDLELMKLCCVQLFNAGRLDDVLPIWEAKGSSWDAHCSIDVQLLCGAGLEATKAHLAEEEDALTYLIECEAAGDFHEFSVERQSAWWTEYYYPSDDPE